MWHRYKQPKTHCCSEKDAHLQDAPCAISFTAITPLQDRHCIATKTKRKPVISHYTAALPGYKKRAIIYLHKTIKRQKKKKQTAWK